MAVIANANVMFYLRCHHAVGVDAFMIKLIKTILSAQPGRPRQISTAAVSCYSITIMQAFLSTSNAPRHFASLGAGNSPRAYQAGASTQPVGLLLTSEAQAAPVLSAKKPPACSVHAPTCSTARMHDSHPRQSSGAPTQRVSSAARPSLERQLDLSQLSLSCHLPATHIRARHPHSTFLPLSTLPWRFSASAQRQVRMLRDPWAVAPARLVAARPRRPSATARGVILRMPCGGRRPWRS